MSTRCDYCKWIGNLEECPLEQAVPDCVLGSILNAILDADDKDFDALTNWGKEKGEGHLVYEPLEGV